jgi:hypothetical protein
MIKKKVKIIIVTCCLGVLVAIPIIYLQLSPPISPTIEPIITLSTASKNEVDYSLSVNAPKQAVSATQKKAKVVAKKTPDKPETGDNGSSKYDFNSQKMADLKKFKNQTDPRIPPILNDEGGAKPTEEQLDNPDMYQQYEMDQNNKQYTAFIKAAAKKITMLQSQVKLAETKGGVSKDEIAMAKEKIARLKAASKQAQDRINLDAPETIQFRK